MINDARWVRGAMSYNGDIDSYRAYAVNHEVGHALGNRHQPCPANGAPAPIMMQQSWSTSDDDLAILDPQTIPADGNVCVANPYPYPDVTAVPTPRPRRRPADRGRRREVSADPGCAAADPLAWVWEDLPAVRGCS